MMRITRRRRERRIRMTTVMMRRHSWKIEDLGKEEKEGKCR